MKYHTSCEVRDKWCPKKDERVRINFDGAYDGVRTLSPFDVVARNSEGMTLATNTKVHRWVASPFEAEALTWNQAMEMRIKLEVNSVIIEGDSSTVSRLEKIDKSVISGLIRDIHLQK